MTKDLVLPKIKENKEQEAKETSEIKNQEKEEKNDKIEMRKQAFATLHEMMSQKYTTIMKDPALQQFPTAFK